MEAMTTQFFKKKDDMLKKTEKNIAKFKQLIQDCEEEKEQTSEPDFLDLESDAHQDSASTMLVGFQNEMKKMNEIMDRLNTLDSVLLADYTALLKQTFERLNGKESITLIPENEVKKLLEDQKQQMVTSAEMQLNEVIA